MTHNMGHRGNKTIYSPGISLSLIFYGTNKETKSTPIVTDIPRQKDSCHLLVFSISFPTWFKAQHMFYLKDIVNSDRLVFHIAFSIK